MNKASQGNIACDRSRNILRAAGNYFIRNSISFKSFFSNKIAMQRRDVGIG